nr:molybdopterin cofactor-binding domain-containing protein [Quisquiliibacterium transsilvanicum]
MTPRKLTVPTRRRFILGTLAATGALAIGWGAMPPRQRLVTREPLPAAAGQVPLNGWVKIDRDDTVTVMMAKSEMGQGIHTALAAILAEELDADWPRVRTEMSPIDPIYNNLAAVVDGLPLHPDEDGTLKRFAGWMTAKAMREFGVMMTGGSSSTKDLWLPMRQAGASARAMLVAAAAQQWQVDAAGITVAAGLVAHAASGRQARFGELAEAAGRQPLPADPPLKDPKRFTLLGRPLRRTDAADKIAGRTGFGSDVLLPGMLYAAVQMCPTLGGSVRRLDAAKAHAMPGVRKVVSFPALNGGTGGVAAIADTPWQAMQAAPAVEVEWDHGAMAGFSSAAAIEQIAATLDREDGFSYYSTGDVDAALATAAKVVEAEYRAPWLAHTPMEPVNCTVQFRDGRATVWVPTQVPGLARMAAARALGIDTEAVEVKVQFLGGGFGRRLEVDFVAQAAAIALQADGAPVQVLWTREQDIRHDVYRPACVSRFRAGLDAQGGLAAWRNTSAGQAIVPQALGRLFGLPGAGPDKTAAEGAFDQPYEFPNARIAHETVQLPLQVGFWRAVGHSHHAFFKEGFMDEVAASAGRDPVAFREALLQRHPRHLAVLQRAAAMADWGSPIAAAADGRRRGKGVALHQSFGAIVAQVAQVSVGDDGAIRVEQVWCAIDCGFAVNPNVIRQQVESAIVYGLSAALHGEVTIEDGRVVQSNFHDYPALRIGECPVIETAIIDSIEHPEGVGEPGLPPIAPAVANAVFAATGQRLRALPLKLA